MPNIDWEKKQEETYELIQQLIQNKCVNPPGNEIRNIKTIAAFLEKRDIPYQIFKSAENRGNLLAKIPGTITSAPSLMFGPAHVDVVPIENKEEWIVDPFSGKIKDGCIWGRGALDMLFIVAAQVQAFTILHEEGFKPKGDLKLLIVSDEEVGGEFGAEWMVKNHPELITVDYALTEAGGIPIEPGKLGYFTGEKGASARRIIVKGEPGHASIPFGSTNPTTKIAMIIQRLTNYKPTIETKYIKELANGLGIGLFQKILMTIKFFLPLALRLLKKRSLTTAKVLHSLSRMTVTPTVINGGEKVNVIPGKASIEVDIRTLPGQDSTYIENELTTILGDLAEEVEIEEIFSSYGNASPTNTPFTDILNETVNELLPQNKLIPFLNPGATDARFMRQKIQADAYGFSLFNPELSMGDFSNLQHGTNERISLKTVDLTLKAYYIVAKRFAQKITK